MPPCPTSAGGYAALLFGYLIGADEVLAFGPQTYISPELRERYGEHRWRAHIDYLPPLGGMDMRYADLATVLRRPRAGTRYHLHYSHRRDRHHVEHLAAAVPNVVEHFHGEIKHNTARALRDRGRLRGVLQDALRPRAPAGRP